MKSFSFSSGKVLPPIVKRTIKNNVPHPPPRENASLTRTIPADRHTNTAYQENILFKQAPKPLTLAHLKTASESLITHQPVFALPKQVDTPSSPAVVVEFELYSSVTPHNPKYSPEGMALLA